MVLNLVFSTRQQRSTDDRSEWIDLEVLEVLNLVHVHVVINMFDCIPLI